MIRNFLVLTLVLVLPFIAHAQKVEKGKLYSVTTMDQFLDVLGPNRTIELAADFFFLPKEKKDGLVLDGMDNLTLIGSGDEPVRFVTPMPDVPVITFKNSDNVRLENLELGHAPEKASTCDGHVVSYINCNNVAIENCFLFGSGFLGISASRVKSMVCNNTTIRGCTGRILTIDASEEIQFNGCKFTDNVGTNEMITINDSKKVTFDNCEVSLNRMVYDETSDLMMGYALMASRNSKKVEMKGCTIAGNSTPYLFYDRSGIKLGDDCNIHNNYIAVQDYKTKG